MLPLPLPLAPAVIVIQASLLETVQAQPVGEVILKLAPPPLESKDALLEERE